VYWDRNTLLITVEYIAYAVAVVVAALVVILLLHYWRCFPFSLSSAKTQGSKSGFQGPRSSI
jgi:hypothetical protein